MKNGRFFWRMRSVHLSQLTLPIEAKQKKKKKKRKKEKKKKEKMENKKKE